MSTEDRKVQLVAGLDTTEVKQGFAEIKGGAIDVAESVKNAGEKASKGIGGIGEAAEQGAEKLNRAERSIIASIQRRQAAVEAAGKGERAYYESLAANRGGDPAKLKPYLDSLDAAKAKQDAAARSLDNVGMSAKQTAAALRGVPAQFTDIATSIAAGQNPLTVLLQQGGQLKDMFGGIGPAARALGGYVAGLVNPFTVAAAAGVGLAVAYQQGVKESEALARSVILTGNAVGTSAGQLQNLAASVAAGSGATKGAAAEALGQIVETGGVARGQLQLVAEAAIVMEKATGQAVGETIKQFSELGKSPVAASLKLNDQTSFLTAEIYRQIRALEEQGKTAEAAALAQESYAKAVTGRSQEIIANLGTLETAWHGIIGTAKSAWDAMLDVGRTETAEQKVGELAGKIADARARLDRARGAEAFGGVKWVGDRAEKELAALLQEQAIAQENARLVGRLADIEGRRAAQEKARIKWLEDGKAYLTDHEKLEQRIAAIREQGRQAGASELEIQKRINAEKAKQKPNDDAEQKRRAQIETIKAAEEAEIALIKATNEGAKDQTAAIEAVRQAHLRSIQARLVVLGQQRDAEKDDGKRAQIAAEMHKVGAEAAKAQGDAIKDLTKQRAQDTAELQRQIAEQQKQLLTATEQAAGHRKTADALREEMMALGMTAQELAAYKAAKLDAEATNADAWAQSLRTNAEAITEEGEAANQARAYFLALADAKQASAAALRDQASLTRAIGPAREMVDGWNNFNRDVEQGLTGALYRAFESGDSFSKAFARNVENTFKTMVLKVGVQATVDYTGQAAGAAFNWATDSGTGQSMGLGKAISNYLASQGYLGQGAQMATQSGTVAGTANFVGPTTGAAASTASGTAGGTAGAATGAGEAGGGSALGAAGGYAFAAYVAYTLINEATRRRAVTSYDTLNASVADGRLGRASIDSNYRREGSMVHNDQTWTISRDLDASQRRYVENVLRAVDQGFVDAFNRVSRTDIAANTDFRGAIGNFAGAVGKSLIDQVAGSDLAAVMQGELGDYRARESEIRRQAQRDIDSALRYEGAVGGVREVAKLEASMSGLQTSTIEAIKTRLTAISGIFDQVAAMGGPRSFAIALANSQQDPVAFAQAQGQYRQEFYSPTQLRDQNIRMARSQMSEGFASFEDEFMRSNVDAFRRFRAADLLNEKGTGLAIPQTRDEFRTLVESVQKMGPVAAEAYAALIQLSPAFDFVADAAEAATETAKKNASDAANLIAALTGEVGQLDMSPLERELSRIQGTAAGYREQLTKIDQASASNIASIDAWAAAMAGAAQSSADAAQAEKNAEEARRQTERKSAAADLLATMTGEVAQLGLSPLERELARIQQTAAGYAEQLADLGQGSADNLAAVEAWRLAMTGAAQATAEAAATEKQRQDAATAAQAQATVTGLLGGLSRDVDRLGFTELQRQLAGIGDQAAGYVDQLTDLGLATADNVAAVEAWRNAMTGAAQATADAAAQAEAERAKASAGNLLAGLARDVDRLGFSDIERQLAGIGDQAAGYVDQLTDIGQATADNVAAIDAWRDAMTGAARATEEAAAITRATSTRTDLVGRYTPQTAATAAAQFAAAGYQLDLPTLLGMGPAALRQIAADTVAALDPATAAGRNMLATLSGLAPAWDTIIGESQNLWDASAQAAADAARAADEAAREQIRAADFAAQAAIDAAREQARAQEELRRGWQRTADSILDTVRRLRGEVLGPEASFAELQGRFALAAAAAQAGDLNAAGGLPELARSLVEAGREIANSAVDQARVTARTAATLDAVLKGAGAYGVSLPSFAVGTNSLPTDMVARVHQYERIVPAADNRQMIDALRERDGLREAVASLTAEVASLKAITSQLYHEARRTANAVNGNPDAPLLVEIA